MSPVASFFMEGPSSGNGPLLEAGASEAASDDSIKNAMEIRECGDEVWDLRWREDFMINAGDLCEEDAVETPSSESSFRLKYRLSQRNS
jgi:hypothetical protein